MKLFNLKNGDGLDSFVFNGDNAYKLEALLWDNTFKYGEKVSFGKDLDVPELMVPSFPVTVHLIGKQNNVDKYLYSMGARIIVSENGLANTDRLKYAISAIFKIIENVTIWSRMSSVRINEGSYSIYIESGVDISNWIQYNIG